MGEQLEEQRAIKDFVESVIRAALTQAERLIEVSSREAESSPQISYSLSILALEEVGKADLARMVAARLESMSETVAWLDRHASDHVEKLFWALFGPTFGRKPITQSGLEDAQASALDLHQRRMDLLYSPIHPEQLAGATSVTAQDAAALREFAFARLRIAGHPDLRDDPETDELVRWIADAVEDRDQRRLILGQESMAKLAELGSARDWIEWLRAQFEAARAEAEKQLQAELQRERSSGASVVEKWRLRVELVSISHSIRPGPLKWWNRLGSPIQFLAAGTKDRLIVEIVLMDNVSIEELVPKALDVMNKLAIAFNLGTFGMFWWEFPKHRTQFVDSAHDLAVNSEVLIQSNATHIEYGHLALSEEDLRNVALVLAGLPRADEVPGHEPFNHYAVAMALIARSDAHLQFWGQAFLELSEAIRSALRYYLGWDGQSAASEALTEAIPDEVGVLDDEDRAATLLRLDTPPPTAPTLEDVAKLKTLCDALLVRQLRRVIKERSDRTASSEAP